MLGRHCERFEVTCPVMNEGPCGEAPFHVANDGSIYFSVGKIARPE